MSAILCRKRSSSFFEEITSSSSSSSSSKRVRFSTLRSVLVDQIVAIFPRMDNKLIEQALENNGHDLDLAIKSLNDLRLGYGVDGTSGAETFPAPDPQPSNQPQVSGDKEDGSTNGPLASRTSPLSGVEWVDLFVREMSAASNVDDARARASRALEALEKWIYAHASVETAKNFQQENLALKEQVQALLQENGILKRAVSIQHERQKEYEVKSEEVQQLKQLLSKCQEHIRTLEVNNYALAMHLKQAQQQNNNVPGRFNPDVF